MSTGDADASQVAVLHFEAADERNHGHTRRRCRPGNADRYFAGEALRVEAAFAGDDEVSFRDGLGECGAVGADEGVVDVAGDDHCRGCEPWVHAGGVDVVQVQQGCSSRG